MSIFHRKLHLATDFCNLESCKLPDMPLMEDWPMAEFVKLASTNQVAPGAVRLVIVNGKDRALFNISGAIFALDSHVHP